MAAAVRKHRDLALRRIDVRSWKSPVAKQYGIRSLPTFRLYNDRGALVLQGSKVLRRLRGWKTARPSTQTATKTRGTSTVKTQPRTQPKTQPSASIRANPALAKRLALAKIKRKDGAERASPLERIRLVSKRGERVEYARELAAGKYTLFEYYADWCKESGKIAPTLQAAVKRTDDLVLRRIRVTSMRSPVLRQHEVTALPHFVLFDPCGKLVTEGADMLGDVLSWQQFKAARPSK